MADKLRYGVFRLGQIWSVVSGNGRAVGFPTRMRAVAAAHTMAGLERGLGADVEVVIQDELGQLTNVAPLALAAGLEIEETRQGAA
jgi:hypothetical protein